MKISNSKTQLARIISENGGWRNGAESAAQCINGEISFWHDVATKQRGEDWCGSYLGSCEDIEFTGVKLPNWHQTILSRDEYFHLYPALGELCGKVTEENRHEQVWTNPPSIEQRAADYRNAKDYADRKQEEADAAKADAEVKLKALELAGEALGLLVSPITEKQEPEHELVITDWRDLQVGDEIEVFNFECPESESRRKQELMSGPCVVMQAEGGNVRIELKKNLPTKGAHWNATGVDACEFKFIRRP